MPALNVVPHLAAHLFSLPALVADDATVQVLKFNGTDIKNLRHLVDLVETCEDDFFKFELSYDSVLVLDAKEARESTAAMLKVHSIPHQMSADLRGGAADSNGAAPQPASSSSPADRA